jgi:AraC-like DNA-binding protein
MKGEQGLALHNYKQYILYKDSVVGRETREKIAELQIKYETEKKEKENISLRTDNEIKTLIISQKNRWMLALIIVVTTLIGLILAVLVLYRKKEMAYRSLVNQNLKALKLEKELEKRFLDQQFAKVPEFPIEENDEKYYDLSLRLEKFMIEEKPYLWDEITLDEICKKLNTNRTYLSKAIHIHFNLSFSDLICEYRIRAARDLLSDPQQNNITIEGIGQMAGFKSNSAFHKRFKSLTGLTPLYFRNMARKA